MRYALAIMLLLLTPLASALLAPSYGGTVASDGSTLIGGPALVGDDVQADLLSLSLAFGPSVSIFRWLGCGPDFENASSEPEGQNSTIGIDRICNDGTLEGQPTIRINDVPNTGWTINASRTNNTDNFIELNTTYQDIGNTLTPGQCDYVWLVANCSFVTQNAGVYEEYNMTAP